MTSSSLVLKTEAYSARTVVTTYLFTLCHNQEDQSISNNAEKIWGSHDVDCKDHIFRFVTLCSTVEFYCFSIVRVTVQDIGKFLPDYTISYPKRHIVLQSADDIGTQISSVLHEKRILSVWCFHFCDMIGNNGLWLSLTWLHVTATLLTTATVM